MLNKLDKIGLRLKIELAAASAIGTIGLLVGVSISNPSGFQKYLYTALGSATASAVAVGVVSALTSPVGVLRLELGKVQTKARSLQDKLDKEAVESKKMVEICTQLQDAAANYAFEKAELQTTLQSKIEAAEKLASEWQVAANKAATVSHQLNGRIEAQQTELKKLQTQLDAALEENEEEFNKAILEATKARNKELLLKGLDRFKRMKQKVENDLKAKHNLELARHQSRIDELNAQLEEVQSKVATFKETKDDLVNIFEHITRQDIPGTQATFEREWTENDRALQKALEQLQQANARLQSPRVFTGSTKVDERGNRIIQHFYQYGIVLDAIEAIKTPQGWRLRFKCDRTSDFTKLTESEFDKRIDEPGLMGLSYAKLDFALDTRNFIVSVELVDSPTAETAQTAQTTIQSTIAPGQAVSVAEAVESVASGFTPSENAFKALGCFAASDFETVIRDKFVPRVRVVAGSTGGKSPLMELISVAIAKLNQAELWLLNPLPGSPKDWFSVPGLIAPGSNPTTQQIAWMEAAHKELTKRRTNLEAGKKFIMVMADEVNALSREYENLGTVLKDFYQLSDHAQMGIITAGQGANVSGVSGGAKKNNAGKLMEEDFQNATQVFTSQSAKVWLTKNNKALLPKLAELEKLCTELNKAEGLSARPKPGTKVVDRNAYRVALVVSPAADEPFFIQIPPYSFYADKLDGVSFPSGATITAPYQNQVALGLVLDPMECPSCGSHNTKQERGLAKEIKRKCNDCGSFYKVPKTDATTP